MPRSNKERSTYFKCKVKCESNSKSLVKKKNIASSSIGCSHALAHCSSLDSSSPDDNAGVFVKSVLNSDRIDVSSKSSPCKQMDWKRSFEEPDKYHNDTTSLKKVIVKACKSSYNSPVSTTSVSSTSGINDIDEVEHRCWSKGADAEKKNLKLNILNIKQFEKPKKKQFQTRSLINDYGCRLDITVDDKTIDHTLKNMAKIDCHCKKDKRGKSKTLDKDEEDDVEDEWEEVQDVATVENGDVLPITSRKRHITDIQEVEVFVQSNKCRKKSADERHAKEIQCAINKSRTFLQMKCHQVHLLCLLGHGRFINNTCNNYELKCYALSLVPLEYIKKQHDDLWTSETLFAFTKWFHDKFHLIKLDSGNTTETRNNCNFYVHKNSCHLLELLKQQLVTCEVSSAFHHNMLFILMMRSLDMDVRLVHSFHPISCQPENFLKATTATKSVFTCKATKNICNDTLKNAKNRLAAVKTYNQDKSCDTDIDVSSGDDGNNHNGFCWWSEVFLKREHKWIYVNSYRNKVGGLCDAQKYSRKPFLYIVTHDNENYMKDLTSKYDPDWLKVTCKKRKPVSDWWTTVMATYKADSIYQSVEDLVIEESLMKQPLPQCWSVYKNHPLYAMKRHLLKYECIYPLSSVIIGYVRGEPVYSRDCVHMLHSQRKWMLEGRMVMKNELPYKVVRQKIKNRISFEANLELFGRWQTEQHNPMPAVDGLVPKNDFGNVELFQPWMLPHGTTYIEDHFVGLNKVAKKLNIDVAPAMMGWQFIGNASKPILKGWVVCEEHKEILLSAWQDEQRRLRQIEKEKNEKKVINNWKILIRGLLIRQRLREKFDVKVPFIDKDK